MSRSETPCTSQGVNIQVVVRCRPPTTKERLTSPMAVAVRPKHDICLTTKCGQNVINKTFKFDQVYDQDATQEQVYKTTIKPIVGEVLSGYNCTVFAYGQTGTGKTHTMEGTFEDVNPSEGSAKLGKLAGMVPRAIQQIFSTLERSGCVYTVKLSIMELYNEELHDMLAPDEEIVVGKDLKVKPKPKLRLFDDNTRKGMGSLTGATMSTVGGVTIAGLEEVPVRKLSEVLDLMRKAMERRQMAETKLNATSSRSHMITTVTLHLKETTDTGEDLWKIGKLNLVDLAGSENILRSGAAGKNQKEAGMINQSLLTLGRVINALVEGQPHVPYRESKLTRLLQDSLGGKTKTCIIATIAPTGACLDETASTLEYAQRAKSIKNRPEVNQRMTKKFVVKEMMETNEELQRLLMAARDKNGVWLPTEIFERQETERQGLQAQVHELAGELHTALSNSRRRDKQLARMHGALTELQTQQAAVEAANAAHLAAFEKAHTEATARLDAEVGAVEGHAGRMLEEVTAMVQQTLQWVNSCSQEQGTGLTSSAEKLKAIMGSVVLHATTLQQWGSKMASETVAHGESFRELTRTLHTSVTDSTVQCTEALAVAKQECRRFLEDLRQRVQSEVAEATLQATQRLQGGVRDLEADHAAGLEGVRNGVRHALGDGTQAAVEEMRSMHASQRQAHETALTGLMASVAAFGQSQQATLAAQEAQLGALVTRITGLPQGVDTTLQGELAGLHQRVADRSTNLQADAAATATTLQGTCDSISRSVADLSTTLEADASKILRHVGAIDSAADGLVAEAATREAAAARTAAFGQETLAGLTEAAVSSQEASVKVVLQQTGDLRVRALHFASQLPHELGKLEATKRLHECKRKFEAELPQYREHAGRVRGEERRQVAAHVATVDRFAGRQREMVQPLLSLNLGLDKGTDDSDDEEEAEDREDASPEAKRIRALATPLLDPQGRKHMRTPLQELVNRECFSASKIRSPTRPVDPALFMSPNAGKPQPPPPSPPRALFPDDMDATR